MMNRGRATLKLLFRSGRLHWCAKESRAIIDLCSLQIPLHDVSKTRQGSWLLLLDPSLVFLVYFLSGTFSEIQFLYSVQWRMAGLWGGCRRGAMHRMLT